MKQGMQGLLTRRERENMRRRIWRGAQRLDQVKPGWYETVLDAVGLRRFDFMRFDMCVVGTLFQGAFNDGMRALGLDPDSDADAEKFGFNAPTIRRDDVVAAMATHAAYSYMSEWWIIVMRRRAAARRPRPPVAIAPLVRLEHDPTLAEPDDAPALPPVAA